MLAPSHHPDKGLKSTLQNLGSHLREERKRLKISAATTAETAGISRMTLYRIERGEPSVVIGGYLSVASALGLQLELRGGRNPGRQALPKPPSKIRLADYPQLRRLAWQLKGTTELTAKEALDLYERNWRHVDAQAMDEQERKLIEGLLAAFGRERLLV